MFAYINGILTSTHSSYVVVEVNGIGYAISVHCRIHEQLKPVGLPVKFYTSFVIREFSQNLYGFLDPQEKELFEILIEISGVGPKLALSFLGHLSIAELQTAVYHKDLTTLCKVPGVGKKTAERLVVELKDKLAEFVPDNHMSAANFSQKDPQALLVQDAMLALVNLGYHQHVAQKALKESLKEFSEENPDLALLIMSALRQLKGSAK